MRGGLNGVASAARWSMMALLCAIMGCSKDADVVDTTPPSAVTDLAAVNTAANSVTLRWTAPADKGTTGNATKYDVRYATWQITDANWGISTQAPGEPKPKRAGRTDTLVVAGFPQETNYDFALKAADEESNWSALSNVAHAWIWATTDTIPPSAVQDLATGNPSDHTVTLTWTAPGDDHNTGTAAQYDVRYSTSPITDAGWASASQAAAEPSPKAAGGAETFVVTGLASDSTYYFALKTADERSSWSGLSNVASATTATAYSWSPLGSGMNNIVNALIVFDGQLIAGGSFTNAGDVAAAHIAAWNGSSWSPLGLGTNGTVAALAIYNDQLIAGGEFTIAGGSAANHIAAWDGSSWSTLGLGAYDAVHTLAVHNGQLIAGGRFTVAGGGVANFIAAWDGTSWSPLGSGMSGGYLPWTFALAVYHGQLAAGGNFTTAGGLAANHVAAWDGSSWAPLGSGLDASSNAFAIYDDKLIAGGLFTGAGGAGANHVAAWNGSSWAPLGSGTDGNVSALIVYNNELIAGGWFSTAGDNLAHSIAAWNGTNWSPLGSGFSRASTPVIVYALTVYNGRLVAAGWFDSAGGVPANNIAVWGN